MEKLMREAAEALPVSGETEMKEVMIVNTMQSIDAFKMAGSRSLGPIIE